MTSFVSEITVVLKLLQSVRSQTLKLFVGFVFYIPFAALLAQDEQALPKDKLFLDGDIIFHTSQSTQSEAIQLATHSRYSHCGIIMWQNKKCFVAEAGTKVMLTPLQEFINRGKEGHYVVKRLSDASKVIGAVGFSEAITVYKDLFAGKPYDLYFG